MAAILYNNLQVLKFLLEECYKDNMDDIANMVDVDNRNILHLALLSKDNSIIEEVVHSLGKSILDQLLSSQDSRGNIPLHLAAQTGKLEDKTEWFLGLCADEHLTTKNELGQTAFHVASIHANEELLEQLYKRDQAGQEVSLMNIGDLELNSPLHLAALHKVPIWIKFLTKLRNSYVSL